MIHESLKGSKILVVDDNPMNLGVLFDHLKNFATFPDQLFMFVLCHGGIAPAAYIVGEALLDLSGTVMEILGNIAYPRIVMAGKGGVDGIVLKHQMDPDLFLKTAH